MGPGDLIAGRFAIERLARSGGMGAVYLARDLASGDRVAFKVLHGGRPEDEARFSREARVLSELHHPGIVRYVAHGSTPDELPWLAMEWLDGEDLAARLVSAALTIDESVLLARRVAEALSAAHAQGVVHRDVKPSNLFLPDGAIGGVKVLDFGVARVLEAARVVTRTGLVLGTLAYMAPEQARGEREADARADLFSLGCVLFECLAGRPPFEGKHGLAVLAKILVEEAPRVSAFRRDVPRALDDLVARLLSKDPALRPPDAATVAAELAGMDVAPEAPASISSAPPASLTTGEQRLVSVILAGGGIVDEGGARTLTPAEISEPFDRLRAAAMPYGARVECLADGSAIATIVGSGGATDQAAQGARCALAMRAVLPDAPIVLATGRGVVSDRVPIGDAIDRAVSLIRARLPPIPRAPDSSRKPVSSRGPGRAAPSSSRPGKPVHLDEVTAGLLDRRFDVAVDGIVRELRGEREGSIESTRTLLGRPTSCVGRDPEIAMLGALLSECINESVVRAVLLTGPAGVGKSRVRSELLRDVSLRGQPVEVWIARGDPMSAGSPFGMIAQLLRRAAGILGGEPLEERRAKLHAKVARSVPATEVQRVAEFLGELAGSPFTGDPSVQLRAARLDAKLMGDQMRRAWEDFLAAECAASPVLVILEDLHWGDLPSVQFIDAALRELTERPLMVLAVARPDLHDLFPRLWSARGVQEIRLGELSRKASERLVRQVLGEVPADVVSRIVAQAAGNAFYLEELIRAVAEGTDGALPGTVLAMVQARLASLDPEARRLMRAGSVFGEVFWRRGAIALLGDAGEPLDVDAWIDHLVDRELLIRKSVSRFPGDEELTFRHALMREGAYASLTEGDRSLGHRLAASFLERAGETNAMVLAEHFERGEDPARAGSYYARAAEQALRGSDTEAAMERARHGLERPVPQQVKVALLGLLCEAHGWRGEWSTAATYAEEVMRLSPPGSAPWVVSATVMLPDAVQNGRLDAFMQMLTAVQRVDPAPEAASAVALALATGAFILESAAQFALSEACVRRVHQVVEPIADRDPVARGWMCMAHTYREPCANEDPAEGLRWATLARAGFEEASHRRFTLFAQVMIGMNAWFLGALDDAERALASTMVLDEELGLISSNRTFYYIGVLIDRGALSEARLEADRMIQAGLDRHLPIEEARGRWSRAEILRRSGELEGAEREARAAIDLLGPMPIERASATAALAATVLESGRAAEALAIASEAMGAYEALKAWGFRGAFARLVHAEALWAVGDRDAARAAIRVAKERLLATARRIGDPAREARFLQSLPENGRTLELARAWIEG